MTWTNSNSDLNCFITLQLAVTAVLEGGPVELCAEPGSKAVAI